MTVAELTRRLVSIPSHDDETAAGDFIESWLTEETDATVRRDDIGNVIAVRDGDDPDHADLALVGHHDVVAPDPPQVDGDEYVLTESDGRLYGRGSADMKGAVAAAMTAFRDADPTGSLTFASFVGEEVGGIGAQHAIDAGFRPDHAVVGEGSTNYRSTGETDVVIAHRGRRELSISVSGSSAHASEPAVGDNALYRACDLIDTIRSVEVPETTVAGEAIQGSVAVTRCSAGTATNVVPASCELSVDERTVPDGSVDLDVIRSSKVSIAVDQDVPPMVCEDDPFIDAVVDALDAEQRGSPRRITKPHATDAGWLAAAGTDCVVVGPSEPGEAHTADESVSIDVLERCYRTYRRLASNWSGE